MKVFLVIAVCLVVSFASEEDSPKVRLLQVDGEDLNVVEKEVPETSEPENLPAGIHDGKDDNIAVKAALVSSLYLDPRVMSLDAWETRQEQITFIMNDCEFSETRNGFQNINSLLVNTVKVGNMKCTDGGKKVTIHYKLCTLEMAQYCEWLGYKLNLGFNDYTMADGSDYTFPHGCDCHEK